MLYASGMLEEGTYTGFFGKRIGNIQKLRRTMALFEW